MKAAQFRDWISYYFFHFFEGVLKRVHFLCVRIITGDISNFVCN